MSAVTIEPVRDDAAIAAASKLVRDFFAYMRTAYPEQEAMIDAYLIAQDFEGQLADFRSHFNPPHGECLLARLDGQPVGVVMLKPYSDGVCELNRMYVTRAARGRGVGRRLCETLIERARALGYRAVRLDALNDRVEALPLYRALGFGPDPEPPDYQDPEIVSMRLSLRIPPPRSADQRPQARRSTIRPGR